MKYYFELKTKNTIAFLATVKSDDIARACLMHNVKPEDLSINIVSSENYGGLEISSIMVDELEEI